MQAKQKVFNLNFEDLPKALYMRTMQTTSQICSETKFTDHMAR